MTELFHRQVPSQRQRRLMITVDVEAQPGRAERDHVDRLIWGRFPGNGAGIGEMMDIADRHGVRTTMFLDYCEEHLYGDALRDVAREIHRRGHDLQLHAHLDFLSSDWWGRNKIKAQYNLNQLDANQAAAAFDFLCERQVAATNVAAIGFRGGGYRFNEHVLDALARRDILLDSSVNVSRTTQPVPLPISKQFLWSNGCLEVPVSCVTGYRNIVRPFDFNFNSAAMPTPASMVEYLDAFYRERGDDAIAVLVMHSWSFLQLTNSKFFTASRPEMVQRYDEFLNLIAGQIEVVTARDLAEELRRGDLSLDTTLDTRRLSDRGGSQPMMPQSNESNQMPSCPICGAEKSRFAEMKGRLCPDCGSVERQRAFAVAYDSEIKSAFDAAGRSVLIFSPSVSELRFLEARGLAGKTSVDIRPETKPDIVADMCAMPQIASSSRDFIFASYLMPVVYDMGAALDEVARVLAPGGAFISIETVASGRDTIEHHDVATLTGWYGKDAFEQYKVASYRTLGEDYVKALRSRFDVTPYPAIDPITGQESMSFVCYKLAGKQLDAGQRPQVDELATEVVNALAARRLGKLVWHSWTESSFASRLKKDHQLESVPPIVSSWRSLADPQAVLGLAQMTGCAPESIDFVFGRDVLDYLPSMEGAIASVARVLRPGGAAVLSIKTTRLKADATPPRIGYVIAGSRYNLAEGVQIASMEVGREWLSAEVAKHGLGLEDNVCAEGIEAFVLRKPVASTTAENARTCNICGFDFAVLPATEVNCGGRCKSRPRTRTIPLVCETLKPKLDAIGGAVGRRLLAFAMTASEQEVVGRYFGDIVSVSLYGDYRQGHIAGVDARDLKRFEPASFDGAFGVLLFDYFLEHEKSLAELMRVLKPGGVFFTHIAGYRLTESYDTPVNTAIIQKRPGYFEYVPDDANMPSVKVGRRWLLAAFERAGFKAQLEILKDPVSGEPMDWFIGVKPDAMEVSEGNKTPNVALESSSGIPKPARASQDHHGPTATRAEARADDGSAILVYEAKLNSNPDVRSIRVTLSALDVPAAVTGFDFAEHVSDVVTGEPTDTLILVGMDALGVSNDLGRTWGRIDVPGKSNLRLWNCFTTATGRHIVQSAGWRGPSDGPPDPERHAAIFLFDKEWRFLGRTRAGLADWHGTASIGQAGSNIMFGDYFNNSERYLNDFHLKRDEYMKVLMPSAIWRSVDEGETWNKSIERGPLEVRHFHTVQADPYEPGGWWASTGDQWFETRVWRSSNNGDNWTEVTNPAPNVELPLPIATRKASCQRFTDMVIEADRLIWGADDLLGPRNACDASLELPMRAGSRIYCSEKVNPLMPVEVGYVGHPIRKFVDVGPGWIVITEAKLREIGFRPQVFFLGKKTLDLTYLFDADDTTGASSGFSYSRGSNRARNGVFFTFKNMRDAIATTTRCLRWEVAFG